MRIQIPARVRALEAQHPGLIPAVGVGATIVAAYAGIAALRRGSAPAAAAPAPFPGLNDLSNAGLDLESGVPTSPGIGPMPPIVSPGGGGYDPIPPVVNTGSGGTLTGPTRGPILPIPLPRAPAPAPGTSTIGGSRGAPPPTRVDAVTTSHLAIRPGTPTPVGHVTSQQVIRRVGPATLAPAPHPTSQQVIRRHGPATLAPAPHVTSQHVIRRVGSAVTPPMAASSYSAHRAIAVNRAVAS